MTLLSKDEWIRFRSEVKNRSRFILSSSVLNDRMRTCSKYPTTQQFLDELICLSSKRFLTMEKGTPLWRAQIDGEPYHPKENVWITEDGSEREIEGFSLRGFLKPHDCKRMTPFSDKAKEGRVNPKGIPCLYTATTQDTALTEMKPKAGSFLTSAKFMTTRDLKIVDFACDPIELENPEDGPTDQEMDSMIWEDLNDAFSEPVNDWDDVADYVPTQIVAELFRRSGFDGIRYKSKIVEFESLEPFGSPERARDYAQARKTQPGGDRDRNVALFDLNSATFQDSELYKFAINATGTFSFRPVNITVFCSDQEPEMDCEPSNIGG